MKNLAIVLALGLWWSCLGSAACAGSEIPTKQRDLAFAVRNVFSAKCVECHGSNLPRPKGRFGYVLDLERLAANQHLVRPFKPEESNLWNLVDEDRMPPAHAKAGSLTKVEKEVIRAWIEWGS